MASSFPTAKVSDMVRVFKGEGDVTAWMQKVELVARLTKVKDLASFIPLYLEGSALAVYLELSPTEQEDAEVIKRKLLDAFSDSRFVAYSKLKTARWTGEPVDVFANDIRRMARESGLTGSGLEEVVKLSFVTGFPEDISVELQQIQGIERMQVGEVMSRARVLAIRTGVTAPHGVAAASIKAKRDPIKCYRCNGPHFVRDCPKPIVCYRCNTEGHVASRCKSRQNETPDPNMCAGARTDKLHGVPVVACDVDGRSFKAMVDTGCTMSVVKSNVVTSWYGESRMVAVDGHSVRCRGVANVSLTVAGTQVKLVVTVVDQIVGGVDVILGMDVIQQLGGVLICGGRVQFGTVSCSVQCSAELPDVSMDHKPTDFIQDKDFEASFADNKWTVRYYWKEGAEPRLTNKIPLYDRGLTGAKKEAFDGEIQRWIDEGILVPWNEEVEGIIPLMGVEQVTKNKVRPVLDFRELNEFVECHTGGDVLDVCSERLREWRQVEGETEMVDLKSAYLQIHMDRKLWKHQLVQIGGKVYALTRLGFGLSSAPKIMSMILKLVLSHRPEVKAATSSYIDDIMVDVSKISTRDVVAHLKDYGLETKSPEKLDEGAVLGLRLNMNQYGNLEFSRANEVPLFEELSPKLTRREVFSVCGKLVGHYPVAGWLRVACSFVKRQTEGSRWDDFAGERACVLLRDMLERVHSEDPVKGQWKVPKETKGVVWCDASDLALGAMVEIGGGVVEDAAWLRKKDDFKHINVAELESALKGVNLGLQWGLKEIKLMTDSVTVCEWIKTTLSEERKIKTKGAAEVLIKRRLGVLKSLVEELDLVIEVICVASASNKADKLTRVKREWLHAKDIPVSVCAVSLVDVKTLHEQHHFGVERTWYLARQVDPSVTKETVKRVVRECERCQSIDPASVHHETGELGVDTNWKRLAIDVSHYRGLPYLTMVDCGPGRFAIWRELRNETAHSICKEIEQVFRERGAVDELLMDNATAFRSVEMGDLLRRWKTMPFYRAAYRASGNGIVERNHRTIKTIAERGQVSPTEAVFWYNMAPRNGQKDLTIPHRSVFSYCWRHPEVEPVSDDGSVHPVVNVGDEVWVKPPSSRCTSHWSKGIVSGVNSNNNIEVDGMPRHVLDLRPVVNPEMEEEVQEYEVPTNAPVRRYPERQRRVPAWVQDYVM